MHYFPLIKIKGLRQISAILAGFFTLLRLRKNWKPDCLYTRRLVLDPLPGVFAWLTGIPLVTETNGQVEVHKYEVPMPKLWKPFWYPLMMIFERILFANSSAVTADGEIRLKVFKCRYPQWPNRFHMVRSGGINLERFRRVNKKAAREALGLPQDRQILVWVGTIFDFSGMEILIQAAYKICTQVSNVDFLIIGDGAAKKNYIRMAEEKGLSHRLSFTGSIRNNELYRWLSACDVALAPYNRLRLGREDFTSYKIFEYLACGLPVICSYEGGGGNLSYISDYELGEVVPLEDIDAFTDAVINILGKDEYFSSEFVKHCRTILLKLNVTWESLVSKVEDICFNAVSKN